MKEAKTKHTDKDLLITGIKKMALSVLTMFIGPTLIYIAFSNQEKPLYIPILALGIAVCTAAIYFAFKGINTIMDSMFGKKK
ncbi:DUF6095 family protein [Bizionia sediminis]|uniref:DUF6095 family protein n=1 Tax=Bizionia sediminis TaxID=1737064 RepID=A0ABW5KTC7_9FLAO